MEADLCNATQIADYFYSAVGAGVTGTAVPLVAIIPEGGFVFVPAGSSGEAAVFAEGAKDFRPDELEPAGSDFPAAGLPMVTAVHGDLPDDD